MKYNDMIDKCIYRSIDTTMCNFMIDFIEKIKTGMYMRDMMNVVLEHLGILQVNILDFLHLIMKSFFSFRQS
jgi:hypothetical protein